jgi:hypothetical protein
VISFLAYASGDERLMAAAGKNAHYPQSRCFDPLSIHSYMFLPAIFLPIIPSQEE